MDRRSGESGITPVGKRTAARKPYEGHEFEYRRMQERGIESWVERSGPSDIDEACERFLTDVLAQSWAPRSGEVIEIGCGTAPMLRWFARKGFSGLGLDVSPTAIGMAKEQSKGYPLRFEQADVCRIEIEEISRCEICVDGLCLHCVTGREDRRALLRNVRRLLEPEGVFIVMTMCGPIDRPAYGRLCPGHRVRGRIDYVACESAEEYEGCARIGGVAHMPTRYLGHWREIMSELRGAGFEERLFRLNRCTSEDPCSFLAVAATPVESAGGGAQ